jgi:hypothetical protein
MSYVYIRKYISQISELLIVCASACGWTEEVHEGTVRLSSIPTENSGIRGTCAAALDLVSHGLKRPRHCLTRGKNILVLKYKFREHSDVREMNEEGTVTADTRRHLSPCDV